MFKQLLTWPPTGTTVIGIGMILGAVDYLLTGSTVQAVIIAIVWQVIGQYQHAQAVHAAAVASANAGRPVQVAR